MTGVKCIETQLQGHIRSDTIGLKYFGRPNRFSAFKRLVISEILKQKTKILNKGSAA